MKFRRRSRLSDRSTSLSGSLGLLLVFGIASAVTADTPARKDASFDYLYIESNEGGSSGGHSAVRFGQDIYHFQAEDGLLVLRRDAAKEFLYSYALLGNRTIHSTRVAVSEKTHSGLLDHFRRRHRAQEAQLRIGIALSGDRRFLERFRDHAERPEDPTKKPVLSILGLGYFAKPSIRDSDRMEMPPVRDRSATLLSLREAIDDAHGPDFLPARRRRLIEAMQALSRENPTAWTVETPSSVYDHPAFALSYSRRWLDLLSGLAALDVLEEARPLASATHHSLDGPDFALDQQEIRAFARYREELTSRLVDLVDSRRADWGESLLIGMARLSALHESIEAGRLVFLDTFPENSETLGRHQLARRGELGALMLSENRSQLDASRIYFRDNVDARELAWERVEERSNRFFEISRAVEHHARMRVARGHLIPSHAAPYPLPLSLSHESGSHSVNFDRALDRERAYSRDLHRLHRYGLIAQNCATALFETINDSFGGSVEISRRQLGGHIRNGLSLAFIPFVSSRQVQARYSVISTEIIPSYRQLRLESMRERESSVRIAFRESNTFTARTYEGGSADSFFVFFTDEAPLLRPLFGVINLTAALGQIALGIVTAPIDQGRNFIRGMRGAFVSLPELAFANIRKGSNDWIPNEHRKVSPIMQVENVAR